ncbi:MAG TPA: glycosyltransferase family 9 protein [Luteolibacter sp.]|nr:glycosyltransferase family 9 protein [Luteolibacter sp.]
MSEPRPYRKILVIKLGALGDILRSLPAMHAVRKHYPDAQIDLLTRESFTGFCRTIPWFNRVHSAALHAPWQIGKWLGFAKRMRDEGYELVIDMQCKPRTVFYHLLWGRAAAWSGDSIFCQYKRPKRTKPIRQHPNELLRQQWQALGIPFDVPADLDWLSEPPPLDPLPPRFVILVPGCSAQHPYKRWPASHFAALAERLDAMGIASIAIGTAAEKQSVEDIVALAPKVINLLGKTSIQQVASLARKALGVVSNDTGPAHLTAMVGTPTLVLMSRVTIPERMLPVGPKVKYLKKPEISDISAEEALGAMEEFII